MTAALLYGLLIAAGLFDIFVLAKLPGDNTP